MPISAGTSTSTKSVAAAMPNTMVTAIGSRNCACRLVSNSSGASPPMVVSEVKSTARSRSQLALIAAVARSSPSFSRSSRRLTRMMESLTRMPDSPSSPIRLMIVRLKPSSRCPSTAPTSPNGMIAITASGRQ